MNEANWDDLRLFLAVARAGGLAGAVAETGKSAPTLGRRMLALEQATGRDLFVRRAREYVLTEAGAAYLAEVEAMEDRLAGLTARAGQPVVKLSAGTWTTLALTPHVATLTDTGTVLRFISADARLDILRREAAIGLRNARPTQPGLAGRVLGPVSFAVYAQDPSVSRWAVVLAQTPSARWVSERAKGADRIEVTSPRTALDLALGSYVRAVLPTFIGDRTQGLNRVGPVIDDLTHDQWLVTHDEDRHRPEVRAVITRLAHVMKDVLT